MPRLDTLLRHPLIKLLVGALFAVAMAWLGLKFDAMDNFARESKADRATIRSELADHEQKQAGFEATVISELRAVRESQERLEKRLDRDEDRRGR